MKKSAFTMMELIFVIIVIGILSAVLIPRFGQDKLSQAANQLISHIRYTQHLALLDDEYNASNANWYQNRWTIDLCQPQYKIISNTRIALDPQTKESMDGNSTKQYDLSAKYGITNLVATSSNCKIAFDHLGRPYGFASGGTPISSTDGLRHSSIDVNITNGSDSIEIEIEPETGYAHLL